MGFYGRNRTDVGREIGRLIRKRDTMGRIDRSRFVVPSNPPAAIPADRRNCAPSLAPSQPAETQIHPRPSNRKHGLLSAGSLGPETVRIPSQNFDEMFDGPAWLRAGMLTVEG